MPQGPAEARQTALFDYGAEDSQPAGLLSMEPETYLGRPLGDYNPASLREYGLDPDNGPLTRHSYLFSADYAINTGGGREEGSDVGKIEIRARVWTYSQTLSNGLSTVVEQTAHRAASCFNTSKVTGSYGGYLDGFNPINAGGSWDDPTTSWEGEVVGGAAAMDAQAGRIDWNVELYDEKARLSGVAQGLAHPWSTETVTVEQQPPREEFRILKQEARDEYEIKPAPRSGQSERAKTVLPGKNVYVNDKPVGTWRKARGTAAVKLDYTRPPTINGRKAYDRQRLIDDTEATYQALSDGGKLYKVEETRTAVYLVTAARRPDVWEPTDPDEIRPTDDVKRRTTHRLSLRTPSAASAISCRRDEQVIGLLGLSMPPWSADVSRGWRA